jgi:hypothetical protein
MCALAAIRDPAAVVRKGGRVVVVEGGLGSWFVPDDCGVGEPGLEQRLAAAQEAWFWSEVRRPAPRCAPVGEGTCCSPRPDSSTLRRAHCRSTCHPRSRSPPDGWSVLSGRSTGQGR